MASFLDARRRQPSARGLAPMSVGRADEVPVA